MSAWLDHLWQATLLAVIVTLSLAAMGRWLTAATRRALLAITLVQFLVPAAWFSTAIACLAPPAHRWLAAKTVTIQMGLPLLRQVTPPGGPRALWLGLGLSVWLGGALLIMAAAWLKTRRLAERMAAESINPAPQFQARLAIAAARAGRAEPPACALVRSEESPGVLGVFRARLFFPAELAGQLTVDELDAILLHEMVHVARHDNLWRAGQTVVIALNWYNPVAWIIGWQLQLETEMACDERVLAVIGEPEIYLSSLAKTARHALGLLAPGFSPAGSTPVGLRLGNILAFRPKPQTRWLTPAAFFGVVAGILGSGYAGSVTQGERWPPRESTGNVLTNWGAATPDPGRSLVLQLVDPRAEPAAANPDVMPVALERADPAYPLAPRLAGISGSAAIDFTVGRDGQVREVSVAGSDREDFAWAAKQAVQRWRYLPARRDGKPVPFRLQVQVVFTAQTPLPDATLPPERPVAVSFR